MRRLVLIGRALASGRQMLTLLRGLTERAACIDRTRHNVASDRVQRATREGFSRLDASDRD
jgi:hypothetical protein